MIKRSVFFFPPFRDGEGKRKEDLVFNFRFTPTLKEVENLGLLWNDKA